MKQGILKKKPENPVQVVYEEAQRMEEQISQLRSFMSAEKEKRQKAKEKTKKGKTRDTLLKSFKSQSSAGLYKGANDSKESAYETLDFKPYQKSVDSIMEFLMSIGLEQYYDTFIQNGIEEMEVLAEMQENHFTEIGIPLGHRLKIIRNLREYTWEPKDPEPQESMFEILPEDHDPSWSEPIPYAHLYEIDTQPSTHEIEIQPSPPDSPTLPLHIEIVEGTVYSLTSSTSTTNSACTNCYKIYPSSSGLSHPPFTFCSEPCLNLYKQSYFTTCPCQTEFYKYNGILSQGQWYCSETCVPSNNANPE